MEQKEITDKEKIIIRIKELLKNREVWVRESKKTTKEAEDLWNVKQIAIIQCESERVLSVINKQLKKLKKKEKSHVDLDSVWVATSELR